MSRTFKKFKYLLLLLLIIMASSCAPSRKNTYYQKRKKSSHVNESQLGRNRYFFSPEYQKKLNKSYKKK